MALSMPAGSRVLRIIEDPLSNGGPFWFLVEDPSLPEVAEGAEFPEITPFISQAHFVAGECNPDRTFMEHSWEWRTLPS